MAAVGPGVIVLGASIGGGEFVLGPTVFVRHGLTLLWVTTVAVFFQTVFNTELMRYTLATGEPVFTGFMRTRPHATFWAIVYAILFFLQVGWPASAAVASSSPPSRASSRSAIIPRCWRRSRVNSTAAAANVSVSSTCWRK